LAGGRCPEEDEGDRKMGHGDTVNEYVLLSCRLYRQFGS
jgi:hypothetical protein